MKIICIITICAIGIFLNNAAQARTDPVCKPLQKFVESINPEEKKSVEFHTTWGSGFKDDVDKDRITISAKRCIDHSYVPARAVCQSLMDHGAVEFSNTNAQRAITCLSPGTKFGFKLKLEKFFATFSYGTPNRGSFVKITFDEDPSIGGMSLKIEAEGY